jgi:hypothetical protein
VDIGSAGGDGHVWIQGWAEQVWRWKPSIWSQQEKDDNCCLVSCDTRLAGISLGSRCWCEGRPEEQTQFGQGTGRPVLSPLNHEAYLGTLDSEQCYYLRNSGILFYFFGFLCQSHVQIAAASNHADSIPYVAVHPLRNRGASLHVSTVVSQVSLHVDCNQLS